MESNTATMTTCLQTYTVTVQIRIYFSHYLHRPVTVQKRNIFSLIYSHLLMGNKRENIPYSRSECFTTIRTVTVGIASAKDVAWLVGPGRIVNPVNGRPMLFLLKTLKLLDQLQIAHYLFQVFCKSRTKKGE
jgi:hypothetical protein